jgi:hypothetical protein
MFPCHFTPQFTIKLFPAAANLGYSVLLNLSKANHDAIVHIYQKVERKLNRISNLKEA